MALRPGFTRYAVSLQYHGSSFLGFSWQRDQEDCILPDGTDLTGYRSVEGRLREALWDLLRSRNRLRESKDGVDHDSNPQFENIQVSSRTDRGVHALHNTLHVDIANRSDGKAWCATNLHRGLNYHLSRQYFGADGKSTNISRHHLPRGGMTFSRWSPMNEVRILNVRKAPLFMDNPFAMDDPNQPLQVEWNARFSATERIYLYRLLHSTTDERDWAAPFEWDRAWRINRCLDLGAMQEAASHFRGTLDVSSFRTTGCQRQSPIVTMSDVSLTTRPYGSFADLWDNNSSIRYGNDIGLMHMVDCPSEALLLTTILVRGNAFVYRQVRNMVGCLVAVGMGQIDASAIPNLLAQRSRRAAPSMAPAHGLFLARVRHGDFSF